MYIFIYFLLILFLLKLKTICRLHNIFVDDAFGECKSWLLTLTFAWFCFNFCHILVLWLLCLIYGEASLIFNQVALVVVVLLKLYKIIKIKKEGRDSKKQ